MTREEIINGLIGIKHFVQDAVLKANFENKGEQDYKEVGETIDFALNAIKQIELYTNDYDIICNLMVNCEYEDFTNEQVENIRNMANNLMIDCDIELRNRGL